MNVMSKILLNIVLLFALSLPTVAQEDGIRFFEGTWEEALQKAKAEDKLIFVDGYTAWCGPCANMAKNIFPLKEVGNFYNEHFICLKSNMEKEGKPLAERYNVVVYPTYLFVTAEGFLAHRGSGFLKADAFIALGKKALEIGRNGYEERFAKGERDEKFVKEYLYFMVDSHQADNAEKLLNTLYEEGNKKLLRDKDYWTAFDCCAADIDSPLSLAFLKDYKKLCKLYGDYAVNQKVRNQYASFAQILKLYEGQQWREVLSEEKKRAYFDLMEARDVPFCKELEQEIEFVVLLQAGKYGEAYELGEKSLANADARMLCNWATMGERLVAQKDIREKMAGWVERALRLGVEDDVRADSESVLHDLKNRERPAYQKGGNGRKGIPMRGYLTK